MLVRDFRPVYKKGLGADIQRRVKIGMGFMPAMPAFELGLACAIGFVDHAADRAGSGRVARIDQNEINSGKVGLIGDELPKLVERPTCVPRSLPLTKPYPFTDSLEVFKGDPARGAFGRRNDSLRNNVVCLPPKASLSARNALKLAADRAGAFPFAFSASRSLLERAPQQVEALSTRFDAITGMQIAVAGGGDVRDAEIDADEVAGGCFRPVRQIDRHKQEPLAVFAANEVALPDARIEITALVATHDDRNDDAPFQGQQRNAINALERHHALIKGHRRELAEMRPLRLVPLVRLANLCKTAHCHLSGKAKALTERHIVRLLQSDLVANIRCKRLACKPVSRFIKANDGRLKCLGLLFVGQDLRLQRQFHKAYNRLIRPIVSTQTEARFPLHPGSAQDGASNANVR